MFHQMIRFRFSYFYWKQNVFVLPQTKRQGYSLWFIFLFKNYSIKPVSFTILNYIFLISTKRYVCDIALFLEILLIKIFHFKNSPNIGRMFIPTLGEFIWHKISYCSTKICFLIVVLLKKQIRDHLRHPS